MSNYVIQYGDRYLSKDYEKSGIPSYDKDIEQALRFKNWPHAEGFNNVVLDGQGKLIKVGD